MKATQELHNLGQSIWLDNITRDLLDSGTLKRYIDELSVTGLTSNPTIFDQAIKNSSAYDGAIREKRDEGQIGRSAFLRCGTGGSYPLPVCSGRSMTVRMASTGLCLWRFRRCSLTTRPAQ